MCCHNWSWDQRVMATCAVMWNGPFNKLNINTVNMFVSSVRSSSVYPGLLHTYPRPLCQIFHICSNAAFIHSLITFTLIQCLFVFFWSCYVSASLSQSVSCPKTLPGKLKIFPKYSHLWNQWQPVTTCNGWSLHHSTCIQHVTCIFFNVWFVAPSIFYCQS